jgi:hypothetical protein
LLVAFFTHFTMKNFVLTGTQKLQARLNAVGTMFALVSWKDQKATLTTSGSLLTPLTTTANVDIVPAPGSAVIRTITAVNIINTGGNNSVFVDFWNGVAATALNGGLLQTRWRLTENGVFDANGVMQYIGTAGAAAVTTATSTTNIALGTGSKVFTIPSATRQWIAGTLLVAAVTAQPSTAYMRGRITAVTATSVTINVLSASDVVGSGSFAAWSIGQAVDPAETNAETVEPISGVPINWANGCLKRLALTADLSPLPSDFLNPVPGKAHSVLLTNTSGAIRTFTLPTDTAHYTPTPRAFTIANNKRRRISAIFDGTSYDWAIGEELSNT